MDNLFNIFTEIILFLEEYIILSYFLIFIFVYILSIIRFKLFYADEIFLFVVFFLSGAGIFYFDKLFLITLIGSILGNSTNYLLGRRFLKKIRFSLFYKQYTKSKLFYKKYGIKSILISEIFGIFRGVTSFLSGIYKVRYITFLKYNIIGGILGILKIALLGYFAGLNYNIIFAFIQNYAVIILFSFIILLYFIFVFIHDKKVKKIIKLIKYERSIIIKKLAKYILYYSFIIIIFYFIVLYFMFFVFKKDVKLYDKTHDKKVIINSIDELKGKTELYTYFDKYKKNEVQPINLIIISKKNKIKSEFENIGWIKNKVLGSPDLKLGDFFKLLKQKTPPVSEVFLNGKIQDYAFQNKTETIKKREHLRLWKIANLNTEKNEVFAGIISEDIGLDISLYKTFLVPFHEFDPDIDFSRDLLVNEFKKFGANKNILYFYKKWTMPQDKSFPKHKYITDGKILVIDLR